MFKMVFKLQSVVVVLAALAACASGPQHTGTEPASQGNDIPDFFLNPPVAEDAIFGVGSARMSALNTSRRMALSRAREDIAFQMNAAIEAAIVDYAQEAGVDGNSQVVRFVETISRLVTETTLQGTTTIEVAAGDDGTVYALISYPRSGFTQSAGEAFQRNQDAAFAEFQAEQALAALDMQLDENPPQAGNVDG